MGQCKKASFSTEDAANYYINKLKRTSSRQIKPIRAYLCPLCFTWHLTSLKETTDFETSQKDRQINNLRRKCENYRYEVKKLNECIFKLKTNLKQNETR